MSSDDTERARADLNAETIDALARFGAKPLQAEAGEKIFLEEETGGCLYVVRSGRVDILTYGTVLENVGPGGFFGEIALIDDGPRSAAAIAAAPSALIEIDKPTFLRLIAANPEFALTVMRRMALRIRRMNTQI